MKGVHFLKWSARIFVLLSCTRTILLSYGIVIPANIPSNLVECYNSSYILTKDNLLPMTTHTFVALLRKIEEKTNYMDMRTLVPAILSRFRFDGIERNPNVEPQPFVIPYRLTGSEFFLFQTLFQQILPSVGSSIPNDTLTYLEGCTLHWMLSSSIDIWDHGDNTCPNQQRFSIWNPRYPRDISKTGDAEVFDPKKGPEARIMTGVASKEDYQQSAYSPPESRCPIENGVIYSKYGSFSPGIVLAGISAGLNPQKSPPRNFYKYPPRGGLKRKPQTPPPQPPPQDYPYYPGYRSRVRNGPAAGPGGFDGGGPQYPGYPGYGPGGQGGQGGGGYPGGNPNYGPNYNPYPAQEIDNKYATTLAGSLAYVALLLGPEEGGHLQVGAAGAWNSTMVQKYYFLTDYYKYALTDARIRGSLDGIILGDNIQKWINFGRGNSLRLSQVINMYYSLKGVFGSDIKACNRKSYYNNFGGSLSEQTYSMAEVLKDDLPTSVKVREDGIRDYAESAVHVLGNYIQTSLADLPCSADIGSNDTSAVADLHVVIDCNWQYRDIFDILQIIADRCNLRQYEGNMTLINGKSGEIMIESMQSSLVLGNNLTRFSYSQVPIGFDFPRVLSQLRHRFRAKMEWDKIQNSAGGYPRVVVFIPYQSVSINDRDSNSVRSIITDFRENLPDVKFLYLVSGPKDRFSPYAENPDKDIIPYTAGMPLDPLITRISTVQRRIINPTCGKSWSGTWYRDVSLNGYLNPGEIHFYKISTNYFFRNVNAQIVITSDSLAPSLTICLSRTNSQPLANLSRTTDVTCNQISSGSRYSFAITTDVCSSSYYVSQCNPYYFSITNMQHSQISMSCNDPECRDPDMAKYTISHTGLSCYSGVSKTLLSPAIFLIAFFVHLMKLL